jgi:hypothetical protein
MRIGGEQVDGTLAVAVEGAGHEFGLMIMIAGAESGGLPGVGGAIEGLGDGGPSGDSLDAPGARHHGIFCTEDVIQLGGPRKILGLEIFRVVVGGEALYAQVVKEFAHVLGLLVGPGVIRREELDDFVAHFGDGANGAVQILLQLIADGEEFESHGNFFGAEGEWGGGGHGEYGTSTESVHLRSMVA